MYKIKQEPIEISVSKFKKATELDLIQKANLRVIDEDTNQDVTNEIMFDKSVVDLHEFNHAQRLPIRIKVDREDDYREVGNAAVTLVKKHIFRYILITLLLLNANDFIKQAMEDANTLAINNQRKVFKFEKYFIKHLNDYFANFNMSIMPGDCLFEVKLRIVDPFYLPKQYQIIKLNDHLRNLIITTPESKWDQLLSAFGKVAFQIIHNQINQITDDINHFYDQRKNITFESREQQRHAALLKFYTMLNL